MGFVEFLFETKKGKTIMAIIYGGGGGGGVLVVVAAVLRHCLCCSLDAVLALKLCRSLPAFCRRCRFSAQLRVIDTFAWCFVPIGPAVCAESTSPLYREQRTSQPVLSSPAPVENVPVTTRTWWNYPRRVHGFPQLRVGDVEGGVPHPVVRLPPPAAVDEHDIA